MLADFADHYWAAAAFADARVLPGSTFRIWKGVLFTIPTTSDWML